MPRVVTGSRATRVPRHTPRALGTGAVLLACSVPLALAAPLLGAPAASVLVSVIAVAGLLLLARLPGVGAPALAAALGAAVPLAAAAPGRGHPAVSTVAAGAALAVVALTSWRLRRRREWAPWGGTRGVVVASAAALVLLAVGLVQLADPQGVTGATVSAATTAMSTVVPWSVLVGVSGWLRHPVAGALLAPSLVQLVAVIAG